MENYCKMTDSSLRSFDYIIKLCGTKCESQLEQVIMQLNVIRKNKKQFF